MHGIGMTAARGQGPVSQTERKYTDNISAEYVRHR